MKRRTPNSTLIPAAVMAGLVLLGFLSDNAYFRAHATKTTGYIVDTESVNRSYRSGGSSYKIGVSYLLPADEDPSYIQAVLAKAAPGNPDTYYAQTLIDYKLYQSAKPGDKLPILYDPKHPDRIEAEYHSSIPPWIVLAEGTFFGCVLAILVNLFPKFFLKKLW